MASDWEVAKVVAATIFAKIANDEATEVAPLADVPHLDVSHFTSESGLRPAPHEEDASPHLDVSHFTIESEFGSSSDEDEEDASAKMANSPVEQPSEASHDAAPSLASLWSQSGGFSKTCERLDNKFLEKLDNCAAAADMCADMCVETLENWKAAADRRVDNLKLMERYDALDEKIGQKVSDTVDVVGQKVSIGVESLTAQIGQKVGNSMDQAKRSGAFQVATQQKDRAQRLFDSSAKQFRESLPAESLDANLTRSKESVQRNFDSLRNKSQAAVIGLPSKLRSMSNSGGA